MPFKVGLTGGIACGKTTVSHYFAQLQVPVIDADEIAHALVQRGQPALELLKQAFGSQIIEADGSLHRAQLRQYVFDNPTERQRLEAILHPLIRETMQTQVQQVVYPYCILSIPLLFETQQMDMVDRILVVDCDVTLQRDRLAQRNGFNKMEIDKILSAQAKQQQRLQIADDIINNNTDMHELMTQVARLHQIYLQQAT